jgi:hypothetical protein
LIIAPVFWIGDRLRLPTVGTMADRPFCESSCKRAGYVEVISKIGFSVEKNIFEMSSNHVWTRHQPIAPAGNTVRGQFSLFNAPAFMVQIRNAADFRRIHRRLPAENRVG